MGGARSGEGVCVCVCGGGGYSHTVSNQSHALSEVSYITVVPLLVATLNKGHPL